MLLLARQAGVVGAEENSHDLDLRPSRCWSRGWEELLQGSEPHRQRKARKASVDDIGTADVLRLEVCLKGKGAELGNAVAKEHNLGVLDRSTG